MFTRRAMIAAGAAAWATATRTRAETLSEAEKATALFHEEGRYLPLLLNTRERPADLGEGWAQQYAALVGDEAGALKMAAPKRALVDPLPPDATAADAIERIVAASEGRRVVMLNEAHVASRHRSFLAQVLRALRPAGFTHLAAEDFLHSTDPTAPDIRKLVAGGRLIRGSGFYQNDPVYAEAIREAAELGYRFVPYESRRDQRDDQDDGAARIVRREEAQADNLIANLLKPEPNARVLVFVGYSHLREAPDTSGNVWFASRLKTKTGIDPLTIGQSMTGSFAPHGANHPLTTAVLERFQPRRSIVVENSQFAVSMGSDLAVFHPTLPDVEGRPGWLAADPMRRRATVALPARKGPFLVQARYAGDAPDAVPADQYLPPEGARQAVLLLRPGRYEVRLETLEGFQPLQDLTV